MQVSELDRAVAARPPRKFTVMLPINRPPVYLKHAVKSVLNQSIADLELCIICDGAPPETVKVAQDLAKSDDRIFVFYFPKGERHGEVYRDRVLKGSNAELVAQIGDDDFWYPDHLSVLAELLRTADMAVVMQVRLMPDGTVRPVKNFAPLCDAAIRDRMITEKWNFFGPSEAGYRLSAYRTLPLGWSPAPPDLWSDLFMWRKFFRQCDLTYASRLVVTSLKFGANDWRNVDADKLSDVIGGEALRFSDDTRRVEIMQICVDSVLEETWRQEAQRTAQLCTLTELVAALQREREELLEANASYKTKHVETLANAASERDAMAENHRAQVKLMSHRIRRAKKALKETHDAYTSSLSWRVTAPVRRVSSLIRRVVKSK